ncbi:MAG: aminotransferase class V-fold PLP-dependent enzyme, partial [Planctomycetales bacterium]|nr:aminotransferase class V-fold PLP-dependent enzyme [Planctomycetales bacterium]
MLSPLCELAELAALADPLDVTAVREEFPALQRTDHGRPLVHLDSAATSLTPRAVIEALVSYYETCPGNVGRGIHRLAQEANRRFEDARETIASFVNADARELIFVRNATEAINLVASSLTGDVTVVHALSEHHSNMLPWRRATRAIAARILADGQIDLDHFAAQVELHHPALVACSHVTNAWGVLNPIPEIVEIARRVGARVLLDASQSAPHRELDLRQLQCDYVCFSGHKMCGPTGIGVLCALGDAIDQLVPLCVGGGSVESVQDDDVHWRAAPHRFEAGTPHIAGAIGLAAACDYLDSVGIQAIETHVAGLSTVARQRLP